jgi:hypothetical protein
MHRDVQAGSLGNARRASRAQPHFDDGPVQPFMIIAISLQRRSAVPASVLRIGNSVRAQTERCEQAFMLTFDRIDFGIFRQPRQDASSKMRTP